MKRELWAVLLAAALLAACGGGGGGGETCEPVEGRCNGLDDDCDGEIDEADEIAADLAALRGADRPLRDPRADCAHPTMKGICGEGVASCIMGAPKCEPLGTPAAATDATCDGFDDNCNGVADDGVDKTTEDNCGGCGKDAAGQTTIHWCGRDAAEVPLEACVDGVCVESNCSNGQDDDGDGHVDCADPDCEDKLCGGPDFRCDLVAPGDGACSCGLGYEDCTNGTDDDCDGKSDCADSECLGLACSASNEELNCGYAPGASRATCVAREAACGDGADDDRDGRKDCLDEDCLGDACGSGLNCGDVGGTLACVAVEADCANGADDDGDGAADCADVDCTGLACSATDAGKNCGAEGGIAGCVGREAACGDGMDDDGDGLTDCADPDCDGDACGDGCTCAAGVRAEVDCGDLQIDLSAIDNDGDGAGNCADLSDCLDEACGAGCLCILEGELGRPKELRCGDFLDNDGDNLQDCLDPDCALQDCSAAGSPGCICDPCPDGVCPQGELACEDGIDNDGDGQADCEDTDCDALRCLGTDGCVCAHGRATESAGSCGDAVDNDHDGGTDCADVDCAGLSCGAGCECIGGVAAELPANCGDGVDNDGDGATDCADSDCDAASCGAGCVCDGLLPTEAATACGDVADNDVDGQTDCADLDCTGDSCGTGCLCVAEAGVGRPSEIACGDRDGAGAVDNDGDALANCDDADCDGLGCGTGVAPSEVDDCRCVGTTPTEIDCGNGADDDLDGLVDCVDPDCHDVAPCPLVTAVVPVEGPAASCTAGHPMQTVVIHGRHFGLDGTGAAAPVAVLLDATACTNATVAHLAGHDEITCQTSSHAPGKVAVTVRNGTSFEGTLADAFTYTSTDRTGGLAAVAACEPIGGALTASAGGAVSGASARIRYFSFDEAADTEGDLPSNALRGEVGVGPASSDSACDPAWSWTTTAPVLAVEPNSWDHHVPAASLVAPGPGTYSVAFRFSLDGVNWVHCAAVPLTVN